MSSEEEVARMEGRPPRRSRGSPGQGGVPVPVTVVYYLCRSGRHLEHPHMMEMRLASPNQALYLRDVIHRLDALRGKGMAAMYSWSCKRRYKTGFVWHDVIEDDMLLPAQDSEYVLKGSLLPIRQLTTPTLVATPPQTDHDQPNLDTTIIPKFQCVKPTPDEESPTHSQEGSNAHSLPSAPTVEVEDEAPSLALHQGSLPTLSSISPSSCCTTWDGNKTASARSSCSGSPSSPNKPTTKGSSSGTSSPTPPSLTNKQRMPACSSVIAAEDIETQTQGTSTWTGRELPKGTSCSTGSTLAKETIPTNDKQPGKAGSFSSGRSGRSGTLESLIRAEALGRRGATAKRIIEEDDEEAVQSLAAKLNPANLLMRLVACGSTTSASQHLPACGLMRPTHKPRYLTQHVELLPSSPVLSPLGALIMRHGNAGGARGVSDTGDCSHCRRRLLQTADNRCESGKVMPTIVRPSSYCEHNSVSEKEVSIANLDNLEDRNKIILQKNRMAPFQQPTSETLVTITTDVGGEEESNTLSKSTSKRMINPSPQPSRVVSFRDKSEKVINIEERLASGARVIIQCAPLVKETYISAKAM